MALLQAYATFALTVQPLPFGWEAATLAGAGWIVSFAMLPLILLLFPTGRPPAARWRPVVAAVGVVLILAPAMAWSMAGEGMVELANSQRPAGALAELLRALTALMGVVIFIVIVLAAMSLLVRYRQANATVRQQLKWFVYGATLVVIILGSDLVYVTDLPGVWEPLKEMVSISVLPAAVAIAIFRYRLYDIDRIIRRTLVYTILTALLALLYFGGILLFEQLVRPLAGNHSSLAIVLSTLLSAALFTPLRRYLQNSIDRHFYRSKYEAARELAEFGRTARDEVELAAVPGIGDSREMAIEPRKAAREAAAPVRRLFPIAHFALDYVAAGSQPHPPAACASAVQDDSARASII